MSLSRILFCAGLSALGFLSLPQRAQAECPEPVDVDPGSTVVCSGSDGDGFAIPAFDLELDGEGNVVVAEPFEQVNNVTVIVQDNATVSAGESGFALALPNNGHQVLNNGTILSDTFGVGAQGSGIAVSNAGEIVVDGAAAEAVGIRGNGAVVTNSGGGLISATGFASEGIAILGSSATVTNAGGMEINGNDAEAIAIEGSNADISNTGLGFIQAVGDGAEAIGLEGSGAVRNTATLVTEGNRSAGVGALGNLIQVVNSGGILQSGTQTVGIGIVGNSTEVLLLSGSELVTSGAGAVGVALAGGAVQGSTTLLRGNGTNVFTDESAILRLNGDQTSGYVVLHDDATFDGFGRIRGASTSTVGMHLMGDGLDVNATGDLLLTGANSVGFSLGTSHPLTSGASREAAVTLGGNYRLLGATSVAIDIGGENHEITNDAIIETQLPDGIGIRLQGDEHTLTNAGAAEILNGGVTLSGENLTVNNEGLIKGRGISVLEGSGQVDVVNAGTVEVGDPASYGEPLLAGIEFNGGGGTVENQNLITGGPGSIGFALTNLDQAITITNSTGTIETETVLVGVEVPELTFVNDGLITASAGLAVLGGTQATVRNTSEMSINALDPGLATPTDGLGVTLFVDDAASFSNSGDLNVDSFLPGSHAAVSLLSSTGTASVSNTRNIVMTGVGTSAGVQLLGSVVNATNGAGATIAVDSGGAGAFGAIQLSGQADMRVQNDGRLIASGDNGRGVEALARAANAEFGIVNSGRIEVTGPNGVGLLVETEVQLAETSGDIPQQRVLANEDTMVVTGAGARGMLLRPEVNSVRIENAGRFDVAGDDVKGIEVMQGDANFILNANGFRVAGDNAVGISVRGDRNFVLNGQDAAVFPGDAGLITPDGFYMGDARPVGQIAVFSAFIDLADSNLGNVPVQGDLVVSGANAIGIDINGDNNRIANVPGFGRDGSLPNLGEGTPIFAQGANSIGVRMGGSGNSLLNEGTITGEAYSVLDGGGDTTLINGAYLFGDVDLGGGDDAMVVREGSQIDGVVRGGDGVDQLLAAMRSPDPGDPRGEGRLNGDQFIGFELFDKVGDNRLILDGTLDVSIAKVRRGEMRLASGASITGTTVVNGGALLTGTGLFGGVDILDDGTGAAGTSAGRWDIAGDLNVLGGILEFEIGPTPGESDLITVGGVALFEAATIRVTFLDNFIPDFDEIFDVLVAQQIVGLETVNFDFFGLGQGIGLNPIFDSLGRLAFRSVALPTAVPEPSSLLLLVIGLIGLVLVRRRVGGPSRLPRN